MAMQLGFELIKELFLDTSIFGLAWLMMAGVAALTLFLITRDTSQWKHLSFPILTAWYTAGLRSGTLFDLILIIAAAIMFVVEALSIETAGRILDTTVRKAREGITRITEMEREIAKAASIEAKTKHLKEKAKGNAGIRRLKQLQQDMINAAGHRGTSLQKQFAEQKMLQNINEQVQKQETAKEKARIEAIMTKNKLEGAGANMAKRRLQGLQNRRIKDEKREREGVEEILKQATGKPQGRIKKSWYKPATYTMDEMLFNAAQDKWGTSKEETMRRFKEEANRRKRDYENRKKKKRLVFNEQ